MISGPPASLTLFFPPAPQEPVSLLPRTNRDPAALPETHCALLFHGNTTAAPHASALGASGQHAFSSNLLRLAALALRSGEGVRVSSPVTWHPHDLPVQPDRTVHLNFFFPSLSALWPWALASCRCRLRHVGNSLELVCHLSEPPSRLFFSTKPPKPCPCL